MKVSISNLIAAPWMTCVVFASVRLKIFTVLSDKKMTAAELASCCGAVPHILKPLLDACVSMGLLVSLDGVYENSQFSRIHLVEGEPRYVGNLIQLQYVESRQWDRLYDLAAGSEDISAEPPAGNADYRTFIKAMNDLGMLGEAEALKNSVDLSGCREMVDAGGGSGLYSIVLCREYPELRSVILDRADTLAVTKEMVEDCKERERLTLREADITKDAFGENIDAVLLSDVVYDRSKAAPILRNAWNCLRGNGTLIIRGYYSDPEDSKPLFGALFVLGQLVFDPNREIMTISSLREAVGDIGFNVTGVSPLTERSFILIARK